MIAIILVPAERSNVNAPLPRKTSISWNLAGASHKVYGEAVCHDPPPPLFLGRLLVGVMRWFASPGGGTHRDRRFSGASLKYGAS